MTKDERIARALTEIRTCHSRINTAIDKIDKWYLGPKKVAHIRRVLWEAQEILGPEILE